MKFSEKESRALSKENQRLKREIEEYRSRERFESHIADLLVRDSGNVLLIFSGKEHRGLYVTSNVEKVFGVSAEAVLEDVTVLCRRSVSAGFFLDEKDIGNIEDDQTIEFTGEFENAASGARMWYTVGITRTCFGGEDIYVVVFKDRTSENYMNQHVQEILDVVEGSNQAKSNFLAGLSHDFRIPMNSIAGYVTLLRKNADNPEKILEYANNISISCQSLMTLINHVVDMNRTGSANTTLRTGEFSLQELVEESAAMPAAEAAARGITFEVSLDPLEKDIYIGDRKRIGEILYNILSNAVHFTGKGGRVTLKAGTVKTQDKEFEDIVFHVEDTGIGMSRKALDTLYEPFARGPEAISWGEGMGLGMAITKKLIELMNGSIEVESEEGKGTAVTVTLRLQTVDDGNDDFWKTRNVRRILIIDENISESARIQDLMEGAGVEAVCTTSGYGGLQMIEQARMDGKVYDIVLLDMNIQGMSGLDVSRSIQSMAWVDMPAVFLMTEDPEGMRNHAGRAGILDVLQKPFFVSSLRNVIETKDICFTGGSTMTADEKDNPLTGLRFLAAEDNMINADILKELLEMEGARCEIAGNGLAALAMFRSSKPGYYDMLLMDVSMPIMDGYEATRQIRKLDREDAATIPILAMTANTFAEDMDKSFAAGMNAHITKPLDIRLLNATVKRLRAGNTDHK